VEKKYEILNQETAFQGYFRIERYHIKFEKYEGGWSKPVVREVFERGVAAAVLLYDPELDQVVLVEQFRVGALKGERSPWLLEIVAGILEEGESPADVAKRETLEEAGLPIKKLMPITKYWASPGGCTETVSLFCAIVDASGAGGVHGLDEEAEDIRVMPMSREAALKKVRNGEICDAPTIIALQWLALNPDLATL
jgi:ADP-ribose pyrophosphatase